jgi:hypothetical protein
MDIEIGARKGPREGLAALVGQLREGFEGVSVGLESVLHERKAA